jgi:peptidyl-prolyl cis-trans isomerase D
VRVNKVLPPPNDPAEAAARQARIPHPQWWAAAESLAYYNTLKERFKTQIKVARPAPQITDAVSRL